MTDLDSDGVIRVEAHVVGVRDGALLIRYDATNTSAAPVWIADVVPGEPGPDGVVPTVALRAQVRVDAGPVVVVSRGIPDRGEQVSVEVPWCPLARLVGPGATVSDVMALPLPAREQSPYLAAAVPTAAAPSPVATLRVSLDWLPADTDPLLLTEVVTSSGVLRYVKVAPTGARRATVDLSFEVPALVPGPQLTRFCTQCGVRNIGPHPTCLACGATLATPSSRNPAPEAAAATAASPPVDAVPVPTASVPLGPAQTVPVPAPPAAVMPPAFPRPVRVPSGGMDWFAEPGRAAGGRLDPGLPLSLVETWGDWGRVVASNGWTAWVDARLLESA